jgi:hypothetical protein
MEMNNCINCEALKELKNTVDKIDKRVIDLETDKKLQTFQYEQILKTLEELKTDINELKDKPSKRWDLVITGLISAAVAYFASVFIK